jgi:type I restriction enzyme R subunit
VTVGMMTTGYDCPDILNLCLMRPIFSPSEFIQIKGRGTRKHNFTKDIIDPAKRRQLGELQKSRYKLFDFFANCEYFEEKFNYDEILALPKFVSHGSTHDEPIHPDSGIYISNRDDAVMSISETEVGYGGMKIDRMYFNRFEDVVDKTPEIRRLAEAGKWDEVLAYVEQHILNKPEDYFTLENLRAAIHADRRIGLREMLEKILGYTPRFKTKEELLHDEFDKFAGRCHVAGDERTAAQNIFIAYITDAGFRGVIESGKFAELSVTPLWDDFKHLSPELRKQIPEYVKDYVDSKYSE